MLSVQKSEFTRNPHLESVPRKVGETNVGWVERNARGEAVHLLLLGGTSTSDFRLRVAQSHLRDDLTPSHWSHVALLGPLAAQPRRSPLYEIPLLPRRGLEAFPATNGVVKSTLDDYDDPSRYPNVALIELPLDWKALTDKVNDFKQARTSIDALELHLAWLAFAWGVGRLANPLYDEVGFPSAALLEYVASALEYDLTPAFPSRSSCPEALWQTANYWYDLPRRDAAQAARSGKSKVPGAHVIEDRLGVPRSARGPAPRTTRAGARKAR